MSSTTTTSRRHDPVSGPLLPEAGARSRFYRLLDYGERHLENRAKVGYFAVFLPDFLIFDEDYTTKKRAHCYSLMGLAHMGLGDAAKAAVFLDRPLVPEPSHMMAAVYRALL